MTNAWAEYRVPQYQHVADEVTPVAAAYLIMALALRGSGRAIGLHHSLRFKYAVFLVIFQLGCVIRMLSKNSFGTNAQLMTGRLLAGSGAAGHVINELIVVDSNIRSKIGCSHTH
jgi:hypothetical protein